MDPMNAARARNLRDLIASGEVVGEEAAAARAELKTLGDPAPPAEPPPHSDDRSNFLSGPVVARTAAEIVAAGQLVRGERQEEPRLLTGAAARMVEVGKICRGEVPEDTPVPPGAAGMIVRAAAKSRGELFVDAPRPRGVAAQIIAAGRKARGEEEEEAA